MKEEKWLITAKKADFNAIAEEFGIDPVLARLIRNRDITGSEQINKYLNATLDDLYNPFRMKGMREAVTMLHEAIIKKKKIRIIGDYDVDGIMATYILKRGLSENGAFVDMVIPDRIEDGYGMNDSMIRKASADDVDLILTCDNGISAYSQIDLANSLGITVIVTDHHEIPFDENEDGNIKYHIPNAAVVVDPKQQDCPYPFSEICGAVIAMKLMQCFYLEIGKQEKEALKDFLEFAALATIGDVMELKDENRIIVKYGMQILNRTENIGLSALINTTGLQDKELTVYHIGFILGPCMNASGRLDTAYRSLSLLESSTKEQAMEQAEELKELNDKRKEMTIRGVNQAEENITEKSLQDNKVLVIYLPDCHESLAGIIAGRIRERYGKPTFILTGKEETVKGSGRSIEGYNMFKEMSRCKDIFIKFGGHKMAAGLSLLKENVDLFSSRINSICSLQAEDMIEKIHIDVPMPFSYVTFDLLSQFKKMEPFGNGNSKPLFAQKNVTFKDERILGQNKNVGKYNVVDENGYNFELIYFGQLDQLHDVLEEKKVLSVTYYPEVNTFRGQQNLQFILQNYC